MSNQKDSIVYGLLDEMKNFDTFKKNMIEDSKEFLKSKGIEGTRIPPELKKEWADYLADKAIARVKAKRGLK